MVLRALPKNPNTKDDFIGFGHNYDTEEDDYSEKANDDMHCQ